MNQSSDFFMKPPERKQQNAKKEKNTTTFIIIKIKFELNLYRLSIDGVVIFVMYCRDVHII